MEILGGKPTKEIINGIEKWSYSADMKDIIIRKV